MTKETAQTTGETCRQIKGLWSDNEDDINEAMLLNTDEKFVLTFKVQIDKNSQGATVTTNLSFSRGNVKDKAIGSVNFSPTLFDVVSAVKYEITSMPTKDVWSRRIAGGVIYDPDTKTYQNRIVSGQIYVDEAAAKAEVLIK